MQMTMMMRIYLNSSLFCEQCALVVDVIDQRFKAIVSLGDPSAGEGIRATDICLQFFLSSFSSHFEKHLLFDFVKLVSMILLTTYPCFKILLVDVIDDFRSAK